MVIREAVASFGTLENDSLELEDGLNIIYAPNESGKSTWCRYFKAMLYGVNSSSRKRAGVLPDKTRYAPWSGAPMTGTLEINRDGKDITLVRKGQAKNPMSDFSAYIRGTSDEVPYLTESNVGETLTEASKDIFERTAFIGQASIGTSNSAEVEKRIAEVVQTGSEDVSYTESRERLKAAVRKRKFNKSGRIPEIDREIAGIEDKLRDAADEQKIGEELRFERQRAVKHRDELQKKVADSRKSTRRQSLERMTASRSYIDDCEADYQKAEENLRQAERAFAADVFGTKHPEECSKLLSDDGAIIHEAGDRASRGMPTAVLFAIMLVFFAIGAVFASTNQYVFAVLFCAGAIVPLVMGILKIRTIKSSRKTIDNTLEKYRCSTFDEAVELFRLHCENCSNYNQAIENFENARDALEKAKKAAEQQNTELLKELDFSESDNEASKYTKMLEQAELELRNIREKIAAWQGKQSAFKDAEQLNNRLALLKAERNTLLREYSALVLALETLDEAYDDIRHRISPRLSKKTAEYFSRLTGNRYDAVALDKELSASARLTGDSLIREQSYLSVGTTDQLYLSLRLAMCDLLLPQGNKCPLILDDALVNFDDERCERAVDLLYQISEQRQIILFTCHRREIEFAKKHANVHALTM